MSALERIQQRDGAAPPAAATDRVIARVQWLSRRRSNASSATWGSAPLRRTLAHEAASLSQRATAQHHEQQQCHMCNVIMR